VHRRKYVRLASLIVLLCLRSSAQTAHCRRDEVQTGEDATSITCTKKSEILCIKKAGISLAADRKKCVDRVFPLCEGNDKPDTSDANITTCVKSCVDHFHGGMDDLSSCSKECIQDLARGTVTRSACDLQLSSCWGEALQKDKERRGKCK
jgi:hypothetical protein